jgi:glucose/arabinose dehydrogenase
MTLVSLKVLLYRVAHEVETESQGYLCAMNYFLIRPVILFLTIVFLSSISITSQTLPEGFVLEVFVDNIFEPTQLDEAEDGRIFVAERTGKIRIIENGILLEEPFYEVETETPGERGVTGLILHPEFDQNGYVYIYHTIVDSNRNRLIRVQASGNTASPETEEVIFILDPMWAAWHNGGGMAFDNEGYLILGVGDGTGWQSAEQMNTTLGKVLRLNDDGTIPIDNPFYDETIEDQKAIYGIGIRNPYTMAKQESTGRIFFNDVGNEEWEEVNEVIEGAHYGWGSIEGPIQPGQTAPEGYEDPLYAYDHSQGCAIVGAAFYEPEVYLFPPEFHNQYFFMEHCLSKVFRLNPIDGSTDVFIEGLQYPNNIMTLQDGSMLITEIYNGRILRVRYTGDGQPSIVEQPQSQTVVVEEDASFIVVTLGEQDLDYQWFQNGAEMAGEIGYSLTISETNLGMNGNEYYCVISNSEGVIQSNIALLTVLDESRPYVEILSPSEDTLYSAGDTIWFSGKAVDMEDGQLGPENFEWNIFFHHNVHQHSALTGLSGVSSGYYVIPNQGEVSTDVWFSISLKATDSAGLENEETIQLLPSLVNFQIESVPSGAKFLVDGSSKESGEYIESVRKMNRTILPENYFIKDNGLFKFSSWSDIEFEPLLTIQATDTVLFPEYSFLHDYYEGQNTEDVIARYYTGVGNQRDLFLETQVDIIDENWSLEGPYAGDGFPADNFSILYSGSILAPYTGEYVFTILHDGKVDFVLDDSLMISSEVWTNINADEATISLNGGERYNFTIEYQHIIDFSRINFSWSFSELPNSTVPSVQLYAPFSLTQGSFYLEELEVFPNPSSEFVYIDFKGHQFTWIKDQGRIEIYSEKGQLLRVIYDAVQGSIIRLNDFPKGEYFLKFSIPEGNKTIKIVVI